MLTAREACRLLVRRRWSKSKLVPGGRWRTREVIAEAILAESPGQPGRWQRVKLLYVKGVSTAAGKPPSKRD